MFPTGPGPNDLKATPEKIREVEMHNKTPEALQPMPKNKTMPVGGTAIRTFQAQLKNLWKRDKSTKK